MFFDICFSRSRKERNSIKYYRSIVWKHKYKIMQILVKVTYPILKTFLLFQLNRLLVKLLLKQLHLKSQSRDSVQSVYTQIYITKSVEANSLK